MVVAEFRFPLGRSGDADQLICVVVRRQKRLGTEAAHLVHIVAQMTRSEDAASGAVRQGAGGRPSSRSASSVRFLLTFWRDSRVTG